MMYARSTTRAWGSAGCASATSGSARRSVTRSGSVRNADRRPFGQDHRALERVLQLAHVAGPVVVEQRVAAPPPRRFGASLRAAAMRSRNARRGSGCRRGARAAAAGGSRSRSAGSRGRSRNRPRLISSSRSRLVAATTRTSTGTASVAPTGITSRSCSTRRSLTCVAGDISPISSRKNVPLRPPRRTAPACRAPRR